VQHRYRTFIDSQIKDCVVDELWSYEVDRNVCKTAVRFRPGPPEVHCLSITTTEACNLSDWFVFRKQKGLG
jgi:hypothetical protein